MGWSCEFHSWLLIYILHFLCEIGHIFANYLSPKTLFASISSSSIRRGDAVWCCVNPMIWPKKGFALWILRLIFASLIFVCVVRLAISIELGVPTCLHLFFFHQRRGCKMLLCCSNIDLAEECVIIVNFKANWWFVIFLWYDICNIFANKLSWEALIASISFSHSRNGWKTIFIDILGCIQTVYHIFI